MLLLVLTSYLFVQGLRLWVWLNFFVPWGIFPIFDHLASLGPPRFLCFPKKVMKKVFTHNLNTLSVYPAIQSIYTEVLGLLVRNFFSWYFFYGFFSFPTDRPKIRERIRQQTKKVNGLRGSTSNQHTINLVPRAFSMAWEGKRPWSQGWTHWDICFRSVL